MDTKDPTAKRYPGISQEHGMRNFNNKKDPTVQSGGATGGSLCKRQDRCQTKDTGTTSTQEPGETSRTESRDYLEGNRVIVRIKRQFTKATV